MAPTSADHTGVREYQASFVIATIIPITTNTTIATCIQIHVGDMLQEA
ncbi:MAG TPA: hypothetical protein VMB05_13980 [Solirubrobacteraceae bacterium]|nr:hypothetical protein [Solirubrobacteraceae bacterium]